MADFFSLLMGFPPAVLVVGLAFFVFEMSPLVFSAWVVLRRRATMRRKLLFVGTVTAITYGVFLMLFAVICLPVGAFVIFMVPALKELGYFQNSYALLIADFVVRWWWLMLPPAIAAAAVVVIRYLSVRWNGIVTSLQG